MSGQDADDEDTEVGDEKATEDVFDDHYGSFIPSAPLLKHDLDKEDLAAVQTLRMDGCGLRANVLETLGKSIGIQPFKTGLMSVLLQHRASAHLICGTSPCGATGSVR